MRIGRNRRTDNAPRVLIGRVVGAHGLRGELKIQALTDNPGRFEDMRTLKLYGEDGAFKVALTVESVRLSVNKAVAVVKCGEIKTRNDAEELIGATLEVLPEERYPLEEGAYWVDDLAGLKVLDNSTGDELGVLASVIPAGGNDIYVVKDSSGADHYIPAVKEFIAAVDLDKKEMRISLIEGLWEL